MDLRIIKTRRLIKETFLILRAKFPLERVRVTDICKQALINKTTFYNHYRDIFMLSDEVEDEIISDIMDNCEYLDLLYVDTYKFIKNLIDSFKAHKDVIIILFDSRMNILIDKVEKVLRLKYLPTKKSPEEDILLSFLIGGTMRVWLNPMYDEETINKTLSDIISRIHITGDAG